MPKTKFLSNLLDSYLFLSLLDGNPKAQDRTLDVCPHVAKERDFLIIGHSGGDSNLECENTLEATEAVFQRSISKSMENVIRLQQNHSNSKAGAVKCLVVFGRFRDRITRIYSSL